MKKKQLKVVRFVGTYLRDERGVTAIEYALIAATTGLALAATLPIVQTNLVDVYDRILGYFASI